MCTELPGMLVLMSIPIQQGWGGGFGGCNRLLAMATHFKGPSDSKSLHMAQSTDVGRQMAQRMPRHLRVFK